jgi:hypothetical protein
MPQSAYNLREHSTCCVYAHVHSGSRPRGNKKLVKFIAGSPEYDHSQSEKRPSPVERCIGASTKSTKQQKTQDEILNDMSRLSNKGMYQFRLLR